MSKITFEDERTRLVANVRPSTYRDDMNRLVMQEEQSHKTFPTSQELAAAVFTYPRLINATPTGEVSIDGKEVPWPPTPEQVLEMSSDAINLWYVEVKRLNPTWFPDMEDLEKKAQETTPQTGSSA